ncbi:MAG: hypothetical protein K0R27_2196 [Xanthobacteraceae bacterium]|nr:hypothetical protein [Xanthobacteraceae bacterium]
MAGTRPAMTAEMAPNAAAIVELRDDATGPVAGAGIMLQLVVIENDERGAMSPRSM